MRTTRSGCLVAIGVLVLQAVDPSAQTIHTFKLNAEGNWETTVVAPDGTKRPFIYVPPNKLKPSVTVRLSVIDSKTARLSYRYELRNDASAVQPLTQGMISAGVQGRPSLELGEVPAGWMATRGGFFATGPGLTPGSEGVFLFYAMALPGAIAFDVVSRHRPPDMPPDMSDLQTREFLDLQMLSTVKLRTIGPLIRVDAGATRAALFSQTVQHYAGEFEQARHPQTLALRRFAADAPSIGAALDAAVAGLKTVAEAPVTDPWHAELSHALGVCAELLTTVDVPLR